MVANLPNYEIKREKEDKIVEILLNSNRILRHDVVNALTSALWYLDSYKNSREEAYLNKAKSSILRAIYAVKNSKSVEEFARKREPSYCKVDEIAKEVARNFDIPIRVDGESQIFADKGMISVIFENLFQNAIQHSGTDRIDVKIERKGGKCIIRVIDYGKGIPYEIRDKIFERGFTSVSSSGSGLDCMS